MFGLRDFAFTNSLLRIPCCYNKQIAPNQSIGKSPRAAMRKMSNSLLVGSGQFFLQLQFLDLPLRRDGLLMWASYALLCRERDVVAWLQSLLRRLYAYCQFLSFG